LGKYRFYNYLFIEYKVLFPFVLENMILKLFVLFKESLSICESIMAWIFLCIYKDLILFGLKLNIWFIAWLQCFSLLLLSFYNNIFFLSWYSNIFHANFILIVRIYSHIKGCHLIIWLWRDIIKEYGLHFVGSAL
jgi:hypothetical protein